MFNLSALKKASKYEHNASALAQFKTRIIPHNIFITF